MLLLLYAQQQDYCIPDRKQPTAGVQKRGCTLASRDQKLARTFFLHFIHYAYEIFMTKLICVRY